MLRYDQKGGIVAAGKTTGSIGGWTLTADDAYTALGDIDGDGRAEILLRDATASGPNHAALLRWDPAAGALALTWEVTGTIQANCRDRPRLRPSAAEAGCRRRMAQNKVTALVEQGRIGAARPG